MGLFQKNKPESDPQSPEELARQIRQAETLREFQLTTIRALLVLMKDFTLDLAELDGAEFRGQMDQLSEYFGQENSSKALSTHFGQQKRRIADYAEDQKRLLLDRDKELRGIIELLSSALAEVNSDNRSFTQKIYSHSEKIEAITRLDDIRKIKDGLAAEVQQIRQEVQVKQKYDRSQVDTLSGQVKTLQEKLAHAESKSLKDGLTGIFNRQAFDEHLRAVVERNAVSRSPFALLIMDIDNFKPINDTYGHPTGDRVLMALVQKCQSSVRSDDFLARYGGEEFVIILPGASLRNGIKKAQHIVKSVASARYTLDTNQGSATLEFTVSMGVSTYQPGDTAATVLQRADQALYAAKANGKNRVVSEKDLP
ncbi:MAG: diguanylate cyclase [Desulfobacterales bacterium]